jgi:hypothetical protein
MSYSTLVDHIPLSDQNRQLDSEIVSSTNKTLNEMTTIVNNDDDDMDSCAVETGTAISPIVVNRHIRSGIHRTMNTNETDNLWKWTFIER